MRSDRFVGIPVIRDGAHAGAGEGRVVDGEKGLLGPGGLGFIRPYLYPFVSDPASLEVGCKPSSLSFSRKVSRDNPSHRAALA